MGTTRNSGRILHWGRFILLITILLAGIGSASRVAAQSNSTTPGAASAQAGSSTWISVHSPFTGDANRNGYSSYEYSMSSGGPWTASTCGGIPGESAWRWCNISGLSSNTGYFVRVTFSDPDGVDGANPQILGPIQTQSLSIAAVAVGTVTATVQDTYILVSVPVSGDFNIDSRLQKVEIATSANGPWAQKCGPASFFGLKLCRLHGLIHNTTYFVRATVSDPDGVSGINPQVLGPILYTGLTNLALGQTITADAGWGCCPDPSGLIDGRIQYSDWPYGFAWTGGTSCWAGGCPPGWKQATIDLGVSQNIARLDWWTHDPGNVPLAWKVEVSNDNSTYTEVFSTVAPQCRTTTEPLSTAWYSPSCGQTARFGPVMVRYVRYWFDDRTLINGIHGWAVELEVFGPDTSPIPTEVDPAQGCGGEINIYGTGFTSGLSARLHNNVVQMTLQNPDVIDSTHIHASIPIDIPAGVYNLTVTNPDNQSGMLANAYMAVEAIGGLSATNNGPTKPGASTTVMATISTGTDVIYTWDFGDGSTGTGTTTTHIYAVPGHYTATVTATNCRGSASAPTTVQVRTDAPPPEDLLPAPTGLWLDPPSIFQCSQNNTVGLTVQRQGGTSPLSNVAVNFYMGNPNAGGTLISSGTVGTLSPNSQADTAKITWKAVAGTYTLYAVIDPTNQVPESDETNNTISRTVTVKCYIFLPMIER